MFICFQTITDGKGINMEWVSYRSVSLTFLPHYSSSVWSFLYPSIHILNPGVLTRFSINSYSYLEHIIRQVQNLTKSGSSDHTWCLLSLSSIIYFPLSHEYTLAEYHQLWARQVEREKRCDMARMEQRVCHEIMDVKNSKGNEWRKLFRAQLKPIPVVLTWTTEVIVTRKAF